MGPSGIVMAGESERASWKTLREGRATDCSPGALKVVGRLGLLKGRRGHQTSAKPSGKLQTLGEGILLSACLVSDGARFCVGGFQDINGKKGMGKEENVSELSPGQKRGRLPFHGLGGG